MSGDLNPETSNDPVAVIDNYIEINKNAFDQLSDDYRKRANSKSIYETPAVDLVAQVLIFFDSVDGLNVLEIGPGAGEATLAFHSRGCITTAVDISGSIIEIAKIKSPKTNFIQANVLDLDFKEKFDVIFAGALIHLFPKRDASNLLTLFNNWLNTDGILFLSTTINEISEEGFFVKTDYNQEIRRFRKKWTEMEFKNFVEAQFNIVDTLHTSEQDRGKKWVAHLCKCKL